MQRHAWIVLLCALAWLCVAGMARSTLASSHTWPALDRCARPPLQKDARVRFAGTGYELFLNESAVHLVGAGQAGVVEAWQTTLSWPSSVPINYEVRFVERPFACQSTFCHASLVL